MSGAHFNRISHLLIVLLASFTALATASVTSTAATRGGFSIVSPVREKLGKPEKGKCVTPIQPLNGLLRMRDRGRLVVFRCKNRNYRLYGTPMAVCVGQKWSHPPPVCVGTGCKQLPARSAQLMITEDKNYSGGLLLFQCSDGYELVGTSMVFCDGVRWSNIMPTCVAATTVTAAATRPSSIITTSSTTISRPIATISKTTRIITSLPMPVSYSKLPTSPLSSTWTSLSSTAAAPGGLETSSALVISSTAADLSPETSVDVGLPPLTTNVPLPTYDMPVESEDTIKPLLPTEPYQATFSTMSDSPSAIPDSSALPPTTTPAKDSTTSLQRMEITTTNNREIAETSTAEQVETTLRFEEESIAISSSWIQPLSTEPPIVSRTLSASVMDEASEARLMTEAVAEDSGSHDLSGSYDDQQVTVGGDLTKVVVDVSDVTVGYFMDELMTEVSARSVVTTDVYDAMTTSALVTDGYTEATVVVKDDDDDDATKATTDKAQLMSDSHGDDVTSGGAETDKLALIITRLLAEKSSAVDTTEPQFTAEKSPTVSEQEQTIAARTGGLATDSASDLITTHSLMSAMEADVTSLPVEPENHMSTVTDSVTSSYVITAPRRLPFLIELTSSPEQIDAATETRAQHATSSNYPPTSVAFSTFPVLTTLQLESTISKFPLLTSGADDSPKRLTNNVPNVGSTDDNKYATSTIRHLSLLPTLHPVDATQSSSSVNDVLANKPTKLTAAKSAEVKTRQMTPSLTTTTATTATSSSSSAVTTTTSSPPPAAAAATTTTTTSTTTVAAKSTKTPRPVKTPPNVSRWLPIATTKVPLASAAEDSWSEAEEHMDLSYSDTVVSVIVVVFVVLPACILAFLLFFWSCRIALSNSRAGSTGSRHPPYGLFSDESPSAHTDRQHAYGPTYATESSV